MQGTGLGLDQGLDQPLVDLDQALGLHLEKRLGLNPHLEERLGLNPHLEERLGLDPHLQQVDHEGHLPLYHLLLNLNKRNSWNKVAILMNAQFLKNYKAFPTSMTASSESLQKMHFH